MKKIILMLLMGAAAARATADELPLADHGQLVLVVTADWHATAGRLQRFERVDNKKWVAVGVAVPVVVGRTGLAWGRGLHPAHPDGEPVKREGDSKAPAGVFRLSSVFGYAASDTTRLAMPYLPADIYSECIDDPRSGHYNLIVDRSRVKVSDWQSSERMRRKDELYRWGVVVDHNADHPSPGAGSCVFLHIWRNPASPTVGCTGLAPDATGQLIAWLDASRAPVLVQLPRQVYERVSVAWQLPGMVE